MNTLYKRPETLSLLTDEQLQELREKDIAADKQENQERDSWVVFDTRSRKWHDKMLNAKYAWEALTDLTAEQFYEVVYWLSVPYVPRNPRGGRPGRVKELASDIKYCMSPRQRAIAYKIITDRFNKENSNA